MHNSPLIPFKSVASDQSLYPFGTELIIAELVGKTMPDGSISDGRVTCVDTGSAILGAHLDLMVGKKSWQIAIPGYCDVEKV
jgi:membrane-bound lytic murein transglycosylase